MFSLPIPHLPRASSPLITTTLQAICINILANLIAQYISFRQTSAILKVNPSIENLALDLPSTLPVFSVDASKVFQFVVWTCITVPLNFRWQAWLERRWPAYYGEERGGDVGRGRSKSLKGLPVVEVKIKVGEGVGIGGELGEGKRKKRRNFKHTLLKILVDQTCAAPVNCTMFLAVMTLLKGGSFYEASQTIRMKFWPLKLAGWKIWPLVGLVNFTFVPVERRVIVSTIIGLCWNVFLVLFIS